MRTLLTETLAQQGLSPDVDKEGNVIASRGTDGGDRPHLVLNTHIDTVPPHIPYEPNGDIVRGRGACDAKGPLAALLDAFFSASIERGTLTLAISPNEETTHFGGKYLSETLSADGYIVGEPTGLDVCTAAKGVFGGSVTIYGRSAHASDPSDGTNAIRGVPLLLQALEAYDDKYGPGVHELLGNPTVTPTRIEGGGPLNQLPAECTVSFDRRSVPPETIDGFLDSLTEHLQEFFSGEYDFEVTPAYPDSPDPDAFATETDAALVQTLASASGGEIRPFAAATEASYFAPNAPTVVFGPGVLADEEGPVAHADREYVKRSEVAAAAEAIQTTVEKILS